MFNLTTSFIFVMNVTLLQNFQPGALQCTKTRGQIWKKFSNPRALLPIFHLLSPTSQTWLWAWVLRVAWRADQTSELGRNGQWRTVQHPKFSQAAAPRCPPPGCSEEHLSPHSRVFSNVNFFLKEWNKAHAFAARDIWNTMEFVFCMVVSWLWQLSRQLKTQVCSLLCWRGFESVGHKRHNHQVMGL